MRTLILAGGDSAEREISIASGTAVCHAIDQLDGYASILIDPAVDLWQQIECDVVFPLLHGAGGEDGSLQRLLEESKRTFVGSGSAASRLTFDKAACSKFVREKGVASPSECVLGKEGGEDEWRSLFLRLTEQLPLVRRWVVKPNKQGSSVGISVVECPGADWNPCLLEAISQALKFDEMCLIQPFIEGREVTVPVVDGQVLPVVEIFTSSGLYDFQSKYQSTETDYKVVDDKAAAEAASMAGRVSHLCETKGIVRVDFRIDGDGQPWFLELNSIPGMTDRSLVPRSAAAIGWSMAELCRRALQGATRQSLRGTSASGS